MRAPLCLATCPQAGNLQSHAIAADDGTWEMHPSPIHDGTRRDRLGGDYARLNQRSKQEELCRVTESKVITSFAVKGRFFYWYMMKDIYSRKLLDNEAHGSESAERAARLLTHSRCRDGGASPVGPCCAWARAVLFVRHIRIYHGSAFSPCRPYRDTTMKLATGRGWRSA